MSYLLQMMSLLMFWAGALAVRINTTALMTSRSDACGDAVKGATYRSSAWRRLENCKCPQDSSLIGPSVACGDGTTRYFSLQTEGVSQCRCAENKPCQPVTTQKGFSYEKFMNGGKGYPRPWKWFVQEQMETESQLKERPLKTTDELTGELLTVSNYCSTFDLHSAANGRNSDMYLYRYQRERLCAFADKEDPAKLGAGSCFPLIYVPPALFPLHGTYQSYWVLNYDEEQGYALMSGGNPTVPTPYGCRPSGTKDDGLWILTSQPQRNETLIEHVRELAKKQGFDTTVLKPVKGNSACPKNFY